MAEQATENVNWTEEALVFRFIQKAADAEAMGNIDAYYIYFKNSLMLMRNYLPVEMQKRIENDFNKYEKIVAEIGQHNNETVKKDAMKKLMKDFANSHEIYTFIALQHKGIQKPEIDGEVDLDKRTPQEFAEIVRSDKGPLNGNAK